MQPTGLPDFPGVVVKTHIADHGCGEAHRHFHMHHELAGLAIEGDFLPADDALFVICSHLSDMREAA